MVVSLSDLRAGKTSDASNTQTGGVVRLGDMRKQVGQKQVQSFNRAEQKFGAPNLDPSQTPVMNQANQYVADHPTKPVWNGVLDNPITHAAGKVLDYGLVKPLDTIYTTIADSLGATNNAINSKTKGYNGETIRPSETHNLAKDIKDIWTNNKTSDHSALEGALPSDFLNKNRLYGTNQTLGSIEDFALQSATPLPVGKVLGGLKGASSTISKTFDNLFGRVKQIESAPITQTGPILGLPEPKSAILAREAQNRSILPPNTDVIHGQGNVETLGLPQGQYTSPTRLKVNNPTESLDYVMNKIKPEVMSIIEAPTRRDLLIQYLNKNGYEMNDLINRPMNVLQEHGAVVQGKLHGNMQQIAFDVAKQQGHDLPALLEGQAPTLRAQLAKDTQSQVYGVPTPKVGIQKPDFNVIHNADAAMPETKIKRLSDMRQEVAATKSPVNGTVIKNETVQQPRTTVSPDQKIKGQQLKDLKTGDELKFAQTVQQSDHTAPELTQRLNEQPVIGARTTDVLNRQQANDLITKHGEEGLYSKLMAKTKQFSPSETTAAQILAKKYSSMGGEANLSKAIELVSKTAKGGREMGQAIQALSQWNKLDQTGALLLGERQLNKGVTDINEWKKLTTEQAVPIQEAAQRAEVATQTKSLADEVLHIVTNKAQDEALTEAEKATIKQFNDQVKSINEKTSKFLPKAKESANETIKNVSQIEPKARTRDQVVSFLDAKADLARKRLAQSRNIGFAAVNKGNPVIDYAIIGASHIAKGVVKLSDFTEAMVRDFGDSVKPHINEAFNQATNIFRKENGLPTVEELDRVVNNVVNGDRAAGRKAYNDVIEKYKKLGDSHGLTEKQIQALAEEAKNNIPTRFTPEEAQQFKAWASEIGHYADHNLKVEATQDLQAAMKDLGDSTLGQKIATIQTGAMLLNPVTMERNVLGNAAQLIGDKASKIVTVPIDWAISKLTGEQRTIVFKSMNQEKFWKNFMIGTKSGWKGVSPNGQLDSYGVHPNVFGKNNPLKYITKLLGASLQGFDHAFYSTAKGEVLATYAEQLGKAQGLSHAEIKSSMKDLIVQLDDRIHELADHAGKYATYQDETMLSKGAEMLRKGLNEATTGAAGRFLVEKGMNPKYSLEGFGAGDVLLKFAKTPANLVMRGIDYSPIGFIRSMMDLGTFALKREKFNQHEAVRSLGRAITGTLGLTGMGYILADAGILTGSASMDKDVRSIQEQSGQGAYKVNWSALGRFFQSGFNYDAAAYQKGDQLMDYQWLQPAAISVAMGVNANKAVKAHKAGDTTAGWQQASKALLGGIQTVLENPMVQGLSNLVDAGSDIIKKQDPTKLINIAKGIPASFVPTLSNQARTATDNNQRETFDKSLLTEIGNMMANKVPGLSKNLPISYDSMGNAREKLQGGQENTVTQYLTSFFSPAKLTQYQVSPEAKMVLDLMNQSGDATILPRIVGKSFKVSQGRQLKDLKVDLNKEQFSQLQQETGKMVTEKLAQKSDYLANPNVALQHKVDVVKKILTDVGKKAKQDIGQQMGYKKNKIK